jgi:hypothetical protein
VICAPPTEATSNQLADWAELEVLVASVGAVPVSAINQNLEIDEDFEPEELDEENLVAERRVQQLLSAIEERARTIGGAYPYALDPGGATLSLKETITPGGYAYIFCLVVSNAAPGGLLPADGPWVPDLRSARSLFQICATVSAAGLVRGPSFSVGWPRPDSSTFIEKLKSVYAEFGDGTVHDAVPPGAPPQVKDDEIDVIAWQHAHGTRPSMGYFLGQAASGANWNGKALKGTVDLFHGTWFTRQPACQVRLGTIMPFFLPSDADAEDHEAQEEIEGRLRRYALTHGDILFRHRIARFVDEGHCLASTGVGTIERASDLADIATYVEAYRVQLRAAASVT